MWCSLSVKHRDRHHWRWCRDGDTTYRRRLLGALSWCVETSQLSKPIRDKVNGRCSWVWCIHAPVGIYLLKCSYVPQWVYTWYRRGLFVTLFRLVGNAKASMCGMSNGMTHAFLCLLIRKDIKQHYEKENNYTVSDFTCYSHYVYS